MRKLADIDYKIIFELMKNARMNDKQIAGKLGVAQPTVSRRRARLEKERLINFSVIPNFEDFGFEVLAFTFVHYNPSIRGQIISDKGIQEKVSETLLKHPNIIFASSGRGLGFEGVSLSIHIDYASYIEFMKSLKADWGKFAERIESFTISMKGDNTVRPLSFGHVVNYIEDKLLCSSV